MLKLVYNPADVATLVDDSGYCVGGRGWGVIDTLDPIGAAVLEGDRLVDVDEDVAASSSNVALSSAYADLVRRRERVAAAESLSKVELLDLLAGSPVVASLPLGGDGQPSKEDLVEVAVAGGGPIYDPSPEPVPAPEPEPAPAPEPEPDSAPEPVSAEDDKAPEPEPAKTSRKTTTTKPRRGQN